MSQDTNRPADFQRSLERYARLLVRVGAGLKPEQNLYILCEPAHRELALAVAEEAYEAGAAHVATFVSDPRQHALLIRRGRLEQIELAHFEEQCFLNAVVTSRGAMISLRGEEDPALMVGIAKEHAERHAIFTRSASVKGKLLLHHGVNRALCPWVVAGAATPGWAAQVFPGLPPQEACDKLWRLIFELTGADNDDGLARAEEKDRRLHARRAALDALAIREVHIHGGGSDFKVGLSEAARWLGGSKKTAFGQRFQANVPTEENFTTPDRRTAEGRLAATMPFRTRTGMLVKGLVMYFERGRLVRFEAQEGAAAFARWIDLDEGARYLGELALVGADSAIAKSGLFFEHTLFDENAWSHAAIGQAYTVGLKGGEDLSPARLAELGFNHSSIHTDIMYGSPEVSITAIKTNEGEVPLIVRGEWAERFRDPELPESR
jgi:aminopeptidase